jgi:hypothetical protein
MIHTARRTEVRVVRYQWHPFFGKEVLVRWAIPSAGGLLCFPPGEELVVSFLVPSWMFEAEICASMKIASAASVSVRALVDLHRLLAEAAQGSASFAFDSDARLAETVEDGQSDSKRSSATRSARAKTDKASLAKPAVREKTRSASAARRAPASTCKRRARSRSRRRSAR